jgi:hypothetical protein
MSWDRKKRGSSSGYYYLSKRVPDKPHPVKICMGHGAAGDHDATGQMPGAFERDAAEVDGGRQRREEESEHESQDNARRGDGHAVASFGYGRRPGFGHTSRF